MVAPSRAGEERQADRDREVDQREHTMIAGDPIMGIRTNGITRLPRIAPVVLTASSDPDSCRPRPARHGATPRPWKGDPSTMVTGRTTTMTEPNRA
jgi:hypothetical protein